MFDKKEYQREWMRKRRQEFFEGKSCIKCSSVEQLELDHIDRSTKTHHAIWSWSLERREAELVKCQVLCNSCHKEKTKSEFQKLAHGRLKMYQLGCRCDGCRAIKKIDNAKRIRNFVTR